MGWALSEDLDLTRQALGDQVTEVALDDADIVHSVWWEPLLDLPESQIGGRRIICHLSGELFRYMTIPRFHLALERVGLWIAQSHQVLTQATAMGLRAVHVPYVVNPSVFHPFAAGDGTLEEARARWRVPKGHYLIGNFHRDSEGADLRAPKLVKGPDIFLEIVTLAIRQGVPVHVLLAGPRRHWLRNQLRDRGIPFTFAGQVTSSDDLTTNRLDRSELARLYSLLDLCLVSSRSEGAPRSILEAAACQCKILSTPVGLAPEVLEKHSIYSSCRDASARIALDWHSGLLAATIAPQSQRVQAQHLHTHAGDCLRAILRDWKAIPAYTPKRQRNDARKTKRHSVLSRVVFWRRSRAALTVSLWHRFFAPPYGGGNQFMIALRAALSGRGFHVRDNSMGADVDVHLLNSVHFDVQLFRRRMAKHRIRVLHRIDGPIHLIRGCDREKDELCFSLNQEFATATVLQSQWTAERIAEMGYLPVRPTIVRNAVDPTLFYRSEGTARGPGEKTRLIASSWSDNPRKGGELYRFLERNLDWDRFEFTFVGRCSETLARARVIPPVPSEKLGQLLREHDIYVTASQSDPCSNALIEALSCGLPALYLNDGGHPEIVGHGGLPFTGEADVLTQLEELTIDLDMHRRLITAPSMDAVADTYAALLHMVADSD